MGILISNKVHEFLKSKGLGGKTMVLDGSFYQESAKPCGCCGPPPSLDYHLGFFDEAEVPAAFRDDAKFLRVQNKMPVVVERLLFDAVEVAKLHIIVLVEEDTRGEFRVYARIM